MNILTFDIEEWALAKAGGYGTAERYARYDACLDTILDILDEREIKGTFFCTGMMATDFPGVVKLIHSRGHEIGCHSFRHTWLNKMTPDEVLEDTRSALAALEDCIGQKVESYRAPAFSIGKENEWVFEILCQCGITRDASVFPAKRDLGGFERFGASKPTLLNCNGAVIKEFPISTTKILGRELAYSGGGYFRFLPLGFVKRQMSRSDYSMSFFHMYDMIPETLGVLSKEYFESYFKIPGTLKNRYLRYIKSNIGRKRALGKLQNLLSTETFVNLAQADHI